MKAADAAAAAVSAKTAGLGIGPLGALPAARALAFGPWTEPSAELRRFSAVMRAFVAVLCTLLLFGSAQPLGSAAAGTTLAYCLWASHLLWSEAGGRPPGRGLLHCWVDVLWTTAMLHLTAPSADLLVITLVRPVALASIGHGLRRGLLLAACAALAVWLDWADPSMSVPLNSQASTLLALGVLALVAAAALLARPMRLLSQWLALVGDIAAKLDPRCGLLAVAEQLVDQLRAGTGAQVVGLVLPSANALPALLASVDEPGFRLGDVVHRRVEALLAHAPGRPLTHVRRRRWSLAAGTRVHGGGVVPAGLRAGLDSLAELLAVRSLVVVPLTRYQHGHGWLLLGRSEARHHHQDAIALAHAAPELLRIVEQAALVDQLQDASASHEQARIGLDLHDSAIQPYLGLKYAVEVLALRLAPDNPARAEVDALAELVNGEVAALSELISGLRTGDGSGDNALVPAVRRQVRRFTRLFGIDVEIDCPDSLATTRALADALFHMVNEALNNIRKHSGARRVWIRMSIESSTFRLVVRDDSGSLLGRPAAPFHPASLAQRTTELHGSLRVSQPDGLNTELVILIPL